MRYWAQPKFIDAGGAMLVSPEAGEAFYLTQREKLQARRDRARGARRQDDRVQRRHADDDEGLHRGSARR